MSDRRPSTIEPETAERPTGSSRAKTLTRDVSVNPGDDVLASVALLRSANAHEAIPATSVATGVETYETLCAVVRERADRLREHVAREVFAIAEALLAAKRDYERTTGTGHGKRNPQHVVPFDEAAADLVGRSARWVQDHVRIAERLAQDPQAVQQLAEMADISLRLVLKFADEKNAVRRLLALEAHRTSGAKGMRMALDGHPLARCAALFLDVKNSPYAQPSYASAILPDALAQQFPELAPYVGRTVGEVVAALKRPGPRHPALPPRTAVESSSPPSTPNASHRTVRLPRNGSAVSWDGRAMRFVGETDSDITIEIDDASAPEPPRPSTPTPTEEGSPDTVHTDLDEAPDAAPANAAPADGRMPGAIHIVKFTATAFDIAKAVQAVAMVKPPGITEQGVAGYAFDVGMDETGGAYGYVSAQSGDQFARSPFRVVEVERRGRFAYPVQNATAFKYLGSETLTFHARTLVAPDGGREGNVIHYVSEHGASCERHTELYPELFGNPLAHVEPPWVEIDKAILAAALKLASPFAGRDLNKSSREVILVRGGEVSASNALGAFTFECAQLAPARFGVHYRHASALLSFLRRCAKAPGAEVATGRQHHFARCGGHVFGWARAPEVDAPGDEAWTDRLLGSVARDDVRTVLARRETAGRRRETLKLRLDGQRLQLGEGGVVPVLGGPASALACSVNAEALLQLFQDARGASVALHLSTSNRAPASVLRTVEHVEIGGVRCRVTRSCSAVVEGRVDAPVVDPVGGIETSTVHRAPLLESPESHDEMARRGHVRADELPPLDNASIPAPSTHASVVTDP